MLGSPLGLNSTHGNEKAPSQIAALNTHDDVQIEILRALNWIRVVLSYRYLTGGTFTYQQCKPPTTARWAQVLFHAELLFGLLLPKKSQGALEILNTSLDTLKLSWLAYRQTKLQHANSSTD